MLRERRNQVRRPDTDGIAITGAAAGIGRAVALALASRGARLALSDLDESALKETADSCRAQGASIVLSSCVDVTDHDAMQRWADHAIAEIGGVHQIYSIAGIINAGEVVKATTRDIQRVMDVNFWGVVHGTKAFLPHIIAGGGGRVVNVSSAFGRISAAGYGSYNASKAAVSAWTDALRQEMRIGDTNVQVTCVYPGGVRTSIMHRATSAAGPEDAARRRREFERRVARTTSTKAAQIIVDGVDSGRHRVMVGADAWLADLIARAAVTGLDRVIERAVRPPNMT